MATVESLLAALHADRAFMSCVSRWETIPARDGAYAPLPPDLNPELAAAVTARGIDRLYSHQAECYDAVRAGKNIVVVTPTASGKTLCYNLPVLQHLMAESQARALYLFPTKALSQDQQSELNEVMIGGSLPVKIFTYDGDTPNSVRVSARETGNIVITNPDMLHTGVLPNHPKWIKFLKALRYVVIDEIHTYRGVFGSHMANVVRRLKRIARFYGTRLTFICCSATIGNPRELAESIIGEEAVLVDNNGAPSGEKHLVFYNPPLIDPVQGIRRGTVNESQALAVKFLKAGIKTIVFSRSRIRTELIASYINSELHNVYTDNARIKVESYRGGYLPNERRAIEKGLRDGSISGVVSTNALELGIDIGGLDAAILAGFPGSIASTWQQAGRAGRRATVSLAVIIASSSPLNQYLMNHPEYFMDKAPESGRINPDNLFILLDHLKCAVFELPWKRGDSFQADGETPDELLAYLEEQGVMRLSGDTYYWADRAYPAEEVSLRSATAGNVVIIDTTAGRHTVIGEMDRPSAKEMIFDNAVYLHRGNQYMVKKLDIENRKCHVVEADVNYYTDAIVKTDIKVLTEDRRDALSGCEAVVGDILVRTQATKFKKLRYHTHENIGYDEIHLPEEEMHTRSAAVLFPESSAAGRAFAALAEGEDACVMAHIGYLMQGVAPAFLLCEPRDLGVAERLKDTHFNTPALFIYDRVPGGTGLAEGFVEKLEAIVRAALETVSVCPCTHGCPGCIGAGDDRDAPGINPKTALRGFLEKWLRG